MSAPAPRPPAPDEGVEPDWQQRRRLAEVFGDGVPEQTSDDRDAREDRPGKGDDWYHEQVPPHHG